MENYIKLDLSITRNGSQIGGTDLEFEIITVTDTDDFKMSDKKYKPSNRDSLFFLPGVNIPRVKIKNLTMSHRIKSIRDIRKADAIFINDTTFGKMVDYIYYFTLKVSVFEAFLELIKDDLSTRQYDSMITALEFYTQDVVIFDNTTRHCLTDDNLQVLYQQPDFLDHIKSNSPNRMFRIISDDSADIFKYVKDKELYDETHIIELLNGDDALVIDDKTSAQLEAMLKSTDEENHTLAMEIMANCEYRASLLHLMILFEKFNEVFKASGFRGHINFKSLLAYLDMGPDSMTVSLDSMVKLFLKREVLTEAWIDIILSTYADQARAGESEYFKCHTITLNDEALAYLNINYTRQLVNEFVPAIIEEVEEEIVPEQISWL